MPKLDLIKYAHNLSRVVFAMSNFFSQKAYVTSHALT